MAEPALLFRDLAHAQAHRRAAVMHELRRLLPASEGLRKVQPFGLAVLDRHLPDGGLACGALHEVVPETDAALPAAFGFVVAMLARITSPPPEGGRVRVGVSSVGVSGAKDDPSPPRLCSFGATAGDPALSGEGQKIFFVLPAYGRRRHGRLSGHGLNTLGLDPSRLILVETAHRKDTLWVMAEALRSAAPHAVAGMIDRLDLKTSQKLQLAAGDAGLSLFLIRPAATLEASAAATRWRVGTAEAARDRFGLCAHPRWHLHLERCRNGRPGEWVVEYDHVAHRFSLAAALADSALSCSAGDRSCRQAGRS